MRRGVSRQGCVRAAGEPRPRGATIAAAVEHRPRATSMVARARRGRRGTAAGKGGACLSLEDYTPLRVKAEAVLAGHAAVELGDEHLVPVPLRGPLLVALRVRRKACGRRGRRAAGASARKRRNKKRQSLLVGG